MRAPREISETELRNESAEICLSLERGESFIVTRNGVPIASLEPLRPKFSKKATVLEAFRSAPHIDYNQFRKDIDAFVEQEPTQPD